MKIALDIGHNTPGDTGAKGITKSEDRLVAELGINLKNLLSQEGQEIISVHPVKPKNLYSSLQQRVSKANQARADLFVSLHFNALNSLAFGSEVFALSSKSQQIARRVLTEICKLGFYDRGVKSRPFYVLKHTTMSAILVECCFCDSPRDMARYEVMDMAIAIKNGIVGKAGVYNPKYPEPKLRILRPWTWLKPTTEQSSCLDQAYLYKIKRGLYTLESYEPQEEGHYWVELKSGLKGFIFASHCNIIEK